ncbi:MAG TPA: DUF5686 family protein [Bacteroidales bacterium]|nr:DUF5686 family protein [Bacteroidales bacterium]
MRGLLLFALAIIAPLNQLFAQEIKGKIIDSDTKKPLPFVNIVYHDSGLGTSSNIDGEFSIPESKSIKNLQISYLGYISDTIYISEINQTNYLVIPLKSKTYNIEEVVILPGENPANRIINKVIDNRDINNPEKMQSFAFTSYNKMIFTIGKDTISIPDSLKGKKSKMEKRFEEHHLLVIETINEKEFIKPDKYNEKIVASKISGFSDPIFTLIASQVQSFSFYNEYFTILDKMYLNPVSKNSTNRYFFNLEDTFYTDKNDTVFVISYRPRKGKNFDGLKGFLHINTNKYAIQSVVASPLDEEQGKLLRIRQNYQFIDNTQWFPIELITEIVFKDALDSDPVNYDMIAKGKSYISDIKINPELNKKDFTRIELKVAEDAHKKADEYWENNRIQPLNQIEKDTYKIIDSISKAENLEKKLAGLEILMNGNIPYKCFNLPLNKIMDYNNYEGYRLGLGLMTNDKISRYFSVGGYFGYGFTDKTWKYGGDLILNLHKESESQLHFSYSYDVFEKAGYTFYEMADFSSSEIYRKFMLEKMDMVEKYEASFSFLAFQYLKAKVFANQSVVTSTDGYTYGPAIATSTNTFTFNEIGIKFRYAYNEKYMQTLRAKYPIGTNYPIVYGNISRGTKWFDGEYNYTKFEAKITKTFKTKSLGKTKITLVGGMTEGKIPVSKLYNGHGSYLSFSFEAENSFGTMRMGEFYSDRFFSVFFKHDFGNVLPKKWAFSPKLAMVHNYGIGSISDKSYHFNIPIKSYDKGFYEGGLLINNILNQSVIGYGFGLFYRYGPYSFEKTADNFSYKVSLTIGI